MWSLRAADDAARAQWAARLAELFTALMREATTAAVVGACARGELEHCVTAGTLEALVD